MLFTVIHNLLQQLIIDCKLYYLYIFIMLKSLPFETIWVVPVYSRQKEQSILVTFPRIIEKCWGGNLHYLIDHITCLL